MGAPLSASSAMPARALSGQKAKLKLDNTASRMLTPMMALSSRLSDGASRGSRCAHGDTPSAAAGGPACGSAVPHRCSISKALIDASTDSPFRSRKPPINVSRTERTSAAGAAAPPLAAAARAATSLAS
eukprot:scaffold1972_cov103-Isochrysis_galbana.AAC.3